MHAVFVCQWTKCYHIYIRSSYIHTETYERTTSKYYSLLRSLTFEEKNDQEKNVLLAPAESIVLITLLPFVLSRDTKSIVKNSKGERKRVTSRVG